MNETLSEKLRSYGISLAVNSSAKGENHEVVNINGNPKSFSFTIENDFSINNSIHQGLISSEYDRIVSNISHEIDFSLIEKFAKYDPSQRDFLSSVIFLDTETTGLAGGTGTLVFLVGFGYFIQGKFQIKQYFLKNPSQERQFLEKIMTMIDPDKILITYNGRTFDIPLLNTRYIINRLESPFIRIPHFDLLRLTRKLWRNSLGDCSLNYLEREMLGVKRNQEEIPGWMIPEVYRNYLNTGDDTVITRVFIHNSSDIISLAGLLLYSTAYLTNPARICKNEFELFAVANIYRDILNWNEAILLFEKCFNNLDITPVNKKLFEKYGDLCRINKYWDQAVYVWQKLAESDETHSMVNLAKYYEHNKKDFGKSLFWTEKAIRIIANRDNNYQKEQLYYRKDRLLRRLRMNENIQETLSKLKGLIRAQKSFQISSPKNSNEILEEIYSLLHHFDQIVTEGAIKTLQGETITVHIEPDPLLNKLLGYSFPESDLESLRTLKKFRTYKEKLDQMVELINSLRYFYLQEKEQKDQ